MQVLDYSSGFPGARAIKQAGYGGAVRYIGFPNNPKCTTRAELDDFTEHRLGMALVFEWAASSWRGGRGAAHDHARWARAHADTIGFPADRPIYFAVDQDVVHEYEFQLAMIYLHGACEVLGVEHVGVYGEHDVVARAHDEGVASYLWQCRAWSGTPVRLFAGRHLYQNVGTVEVGDVDCDTNDVLATDWGQHTMEEDVTPDELLNTPVDQEFSEEIGAALGIEPDANGRYLKKGVTLRTLLMWTDNRVESLKAEVAQAREEIAVLAERPTTATLTPEQLEQLAQRLEERFGAVAQSSVRNALQTMQMNIPSGTATFSPKPPPTGG